MQLVVDLALHEKAGLNRADFLDRFAPVEAIRTNKPPNYEEGLTFYIHSLDSFMLHRHIKDAITSGNFDGLNGHFSCVHGAIGIPDLLFNWYSNTDQDTILRQIICWLAALYAFDLDRRHIMKRQLYPLIFEEVITVAKNYFQIETSSVPTDVREWTPLYHAAAMGYYNSRPPSLLELPRPFFGFENLREWGVHDEFDLQFDRFFFRPDDWSLLKEGKIDSLDWSLLKEGSILQSLNSREDWVRIKHQLVTGVQQKKHVFSLFDRPTEKGTIYVIREGDTNRYKIGYTNTSPEQRMAALQTGNSTVLSIVGSFPCSGQPTERTLHALFDYARCSGEWFSLKQGDVIAILSAKWRAEKGVF